MNRITQRSTLLPATAALIYILLTLPVWRWLWREWMANDYYSHGLLIVPVALYLAVQRVRHDKLFVWSPDDRTLPGIALLAVGLAAYLFFFYNLAFYLAAFAMILMLLGGVWALGGQPAAVRLLFPVGYLLLMVPLPFVERATLPLALFTGVCSAALVRVLGFGVNIVGNAVQLPNANLVIGAQCSGINSLIALTALLALAAYLLQGPWWGRLLLVLVAVPLAMGSNILRVASLLVVARSYGADAAFIFYHDYSGPIFFVLALLLAYPLARLLRCRTLRLDVI